MKKRALVFLLLGLYLGLHNGYITLWSTEQSQPVQVFPYRAALYPKADQQALCQGIPISDEEHLHKLLEDFLS